MASASDGKTHRHRRVAVVALTCHIHSARLYQYPNCTSEHRRFLGWLAGCAQHKLVFFSSAPTHTGQTPKQTRTQYAIAARQTFRLDRDSTFTLQPVQYKEERSTHQKVSRCLQLQFMWCTSSAMTTTPRSLPERSLVTLKRSFSSDEEPIGLDRDLQVAQVLEQVAALTMNNNNTCTSNSNSNMFHTLAKDDSCFLDKNDENENDYDLLQKKPAATAKTSSASAAEFPFSTPQSSTSNNNNNQTQARLSLLQGIKTPTTQSQSQPPYNSLSQTTTATTASSNRLRSNSTSFLVHNAPRLPASPDLLDVDSQQFRQETNDNQDFVHFPRLNGPPPLFSPLYQTTMVRMFPTHATTAAVPPLFQERSSSSSSSLHLAFLAQPDYNNSIPELQVPPNANPNADAFNNVGNNKRRNEQRPPPPPMPLIGSPTGSDGGRSTTRRLLKMRRKEMTTTDLLQPPTALSFSP